MSTLKQNSAYNQTFLMISSVDHVSPLLSAQPIVSLSKLGAAFYQAAGAVSEVGNGWYQVQLSAFDTNTVGNLLFHITAAGGDDTDFADQVMATPTQNSAYSQAFLMISSSDNVSPLLGAQPVVALSKSGGAFYQPVGAVSEVGNGWYEVQLSPLDTNTLGSLVFHITATGGDNTDFSDQVVAAPPAPPPQSGQCPVIFNYQTWVSMFGEFSALTPAQGGAYFVRATGNFAANSCSNPAFRDGRLEYLLYLATSHIAWLSCPKDDNGNPAATGTIASQLVGRISSAQEGSVNVQTEWDVTGDTSSLEAFLTQTKYGAEYWAAIQNYRTARYLPNPTRVVNGILPGIYSPGGFFRR